MAREEKQDKKAEGANTTSPQDENPALGIKRVRTFASDLALAKKNAADVDDTPEKENKPFANDANTEEISKSNTLQPEVDMSKTPALEETGKEQQPSKEYIEQELARSGIVADDEDDSSGVKEDVKTDVSPIRTYKYDAADQIEKGGFSQIKILAAEQDRQKQSGNSVSFFSDDDTPLKRNLILVGISIVLIGSGLFGVLFFYNRGSSVDTEPITQAAQNALFTDGTIEIDMSEGDDPLISRIIEKTKNARTKTGSLTELLILNNSIFGTGKISKDELFREMNSHAPGQLVRNLQNSYTIGVHVGEMNSTFYLFKIDDFEAVFSGMLEWEGAIHGNLYKEPLSTKFEDTFLQNKDTRIQRDGFGNVKLIYAFPNNETLILAENEGAFLELFRRLSVSNASRN